MKTQNEDGITMAIAPNSRGFGYIVFESPDVPMDWGVKDVRKNKTRDCLFKASVLMHMFHPSGVILEDVAHSSSRRSNRVRDLIGRLAELANERGIAVAWCSRGDVLTAFAQTGARTKDDIATAIIKVVPELAQRLPPRRRIWDSEHYSMAIFEAAALALTHFTGKHEGD